jgi:hypothetical protein
VEFARGHSQTQTAGGFHRLAAGPAAVSPAEQKAEIAKLAAREGFSIAE